MRDEDPVYNRINPPAGKQPNELIIPVPLPTEIPRPPDLSSLPAHILHSGTVETLIGQNEDLMARLKVNIRRNSILEQQIFEHENVISEIRRRNEALAAQVAIIREKDSVWKEKNQRIEAQFNDLRSEIELWEVRYAEMYTASQDKEKQWTQERRDYDWRLAVLDGYRRRVRSWVRRRFNQMKTALRATEARLAELQDESQKKDSRIFDLQERMNRLATHVQSQDRIFQEDQARLVEQYEEKAQGLREENEQLTLDLRYFRERAHKLEEAQTKLTESENMNVLLQRRIEDADRKFNAEIGELQKQLTHFRLETKNLAIEMNHTVQARVKAERAMNTAQEENGRLKDQLESLQALWADGQKRLEESSLKCDSLTRLNQELSRRLNDQRRQFELQLTTRHAGASNAEGSIHPASAIVPTPEATVSSAVRAVDDRFDKIESILAELQSGFPKTHGESTRDN